MRKRKLPKAAPRPTELSRSLYKLRAASGLSRAEMAKRLKWSEIRVYRAETGWTRPRAEDVVAWARALGRSVAEVYGGAA